MIIFANLLKRERLEIVQRQQRLERANVARPAIEGVLTFSVERQKVHGNGQIGESQTRNLWT